MTDDMTVVEKEELAKRISDLSQKQLNDFFNEEGKARSSALIDSILNNMGNTFKHTSGQHAGKPMVTKLSKILGVTKGGAVSDTLRGKRDLPNRHKLKLINRWAKIAKLKDPVNDLIFDSKNRMKDKNTGRFI